MLSSLPAVSLRLHPLDDILIKRVELGINEQTPQTMETFRKLLVNLFSVGGGRRLLASLERRVTSWQRRAENHFRRRPDSDLSISVRPGICHNISRRRENLFAFRITRRELTKANLLVALVVAAS
jgi:hypothetical protein